VIGGSTRLRGFLGGMKVNSTGSGEEKKDEVFPGEAGVGSQNTGKSRDTARRRVAETKNKRRSGRGEEGESEGADILGYGTGPSGKSGNTTHGGGVRERTREGSAFGLAGNRAPLKLGKKFKESGKMVGKQGRERLFLEKRERRCKCNSTKTFGGKNLGVGRKKRGPRGQPKERGHRQNICTNRKWVRGKH